MAAACAFGMEISSPSGPLAGPLTREHISVPFLISQCFTTTITLLPQWYGVFSCRGGDCCPPARETLMHKLRRTVMTFRENIKRHEGIIGLLSSANYSSAKVVLFTFALSVSTRTRPEVHLARHHRQL